MTDTAQDYMHLARLALSGDQHDVAAAIRRGLHRIVKERPDLAPLAREILQGTKTISVLREAQSALPIDMESKLELLRREEITRVEPQPLWPGGVLLELSDVIEERRRETELI